MITITAKLTVFFEEPFWVGVCEHTENGKTEVCKVVFGAEPRGYDVYEYFSQHWRELRFSPPIATDHQKERKVIPKKLQRMVRDQLASNYGIGTKAQQALKLMQESNKEERKAVHKRRTEEEKQRQFELRQQKKKQKHKGR